MEHSEEEDAVDDLLIASSFADSSSLPAPALVAPEALKRLRLDLTAALAAPAPAARGLCS